MFSRSVKVILAGAPQAGKSALHLALAGLNTPSAMGLAGRPYQETQGVDYRSCIVAAGDHMHAADVYGTKLHLWDLAGQPRFRALTRPHVPGTHVLLAVYDATHLEAARKSLDVLVVDWLTREEILRSAPGLVYLVGVSTGPAPGPPPSALLAPAIIDAATVLQRVFQKSARVVVAVDVHAWTPASVKSLATRIVRDAWSRGVGTSHDALHVHPVPVPVSAARESRDSCRTSLIKTKRASMTVLRDGRDGPDGREARSARNKKCCPRVGCVIL